MGWKKKFKHGWDKTRDFTVFANDGPLDVSKWGGGGGNKVDSESTLTPDQEAYLSQLTKLSGQYLPQTMSALGSIVANPQNNYSKLNNWENEFQTGVVNPALSQMNSAIANTQHSSNIHSMANRLAQDKYRQNTTSQLAGLRYDQLMKERNMQMQGLDNADAQRMSAIGALNNLTATSLGTQGVENIVTPKTSWLDYLNTGANVIGALR